jgi:putative ABC transport system substrate-binding protein
MRRRGVMALFASTAATWAVPARAQARRPRIGALFTGNPEPQWRLFRDALRPLGHIDGQTIQFELRTAGGNAERLPALAAEFVRLPVDLIVAFQTPAVQAARQATRDIPIVMATSGDPVATGLVASLARPGGNVTGMASATAELAAKTMELIREMLPGARRVAVLTNIADSFTVPFLNHIRHGARAVGLSVQPLAVGGAVEFESAFDSIRREGADAVIHQPSLPRSRAIALALQYRVPSISPTRVFAAEGGLLSYGGNLVAQFREAAVYVDKIIKGARPADLPVQEATTFELAVNLKTAKALGLTLPRTLLLRADELIE